MSAIEEVAAERARQRLEEGWTSEHDDSHDDGVLARAAACYALNATGIVADVFWPFARRWWKPKSPRRDLIRAAALLVAEIERMDRATANLTEELTRMNHE